MTLANRRVVAIACDPLSLFEFAIAAELFGLPRPELDIDWYDFQVVSLASAPLASLGGVTVNTPTGLKRLDSAGTIIIPGWTERSRRPPASLIKALQNAHARGARLVSICSGVFALAATGLLDGAAATTHWRYIDELRSMYPAIDVQPGILYVDNGKVFTSAGSAAGIDLGLHIIRRDFGAAIANEVARGMVVPAHREGGQAQFIRQPVATEPSLSIGDTLDWALEQLHSPLTTRALAEHAGMSERTFTRRFESITGMSPHRWLTRNRVQHACDLLESTQASIDRVAERVGLGSAANLRHHFKRELKTSPSRYRKAFQKV